MSRVHDLLFLVECLQSALAVFESRARPASMCGRRALARARLQRGTSIEQLAAPRHLDCDSSVLFSSGTGIGLRPPQVFRALVLALHSLALLADAKHCT